MNDTKKTAAEPIPLREEHGAGTPLREEWDDFVDRREYLYDDPTFDTGHPASFTSREDRRDGAFRPVYETEQDLARIRSEARQLVLTSGIRTGALEALTNYVLGSGFSFVVHSLREPWGRFSNLPVVLPEAGPGGQDVRPGDVDGPVGKLAPQAVQDFINEFIDDNDFCGSLDREMHVRSREDGEAFILLSPRPGGRVRASLIEPDQVTEPANPRPLEEWLGICDAFPSCWRFGIHTRAGETDEPLGFHIANDGAGREWDYVPAARLQHIKRNVTRNAKRGVSDFYEIARDLRQEAKLRRNMAAGAALQAAIAWILELPAGTTAEQAKAISSSMAVYGFRAGTRSREMFTELYGPGTILRPGPGQVYRPGPHGADRNSGFQIVGQYMLRSVGVRWNMPEYMISGDASNANYASTLVAESPFVKAREADQQFYRRHFLSLVWKALRLAWEAGRFERLGLSWNRLYRQIDIKCDVPAVATRDTLKLAQTQETQIRLGILSRRTAAAQAGLDYDAEVKNGAQ